MEYFDLSGDVFFRELYPISRFSPAMKLFGTMLRGCRATCCLVALFLATGISLPASTVWTGPLFFYSQPSPDPTQASNQDRLTPDVWLTRAASKGLFNAFYETNATALSPTNTEWAFGTLTNYASLQYTNWLAWLNGASPTTLIGQSAVVHLISDDIYLSIQFTAWASGGTGGFAYERSTPPLPVVWTGPMTSYSQPSPDPTQPANQDRLTPDVWITRGLSEGIFNAVTETSYTHFFSPEDTEWADGTTATYSSLSYTNWEAWAKVIHGGPPNTIGVNAVVHLISENIYLDLTFTSWGESSSGGFSYVRSTPAPSVSITNPANGTVFAAPANIHLGASASVTGGTVTNVAFLVNGSSVGSVQTVPFNLTAGPLAAGPYALAAVATVSGISTTSAVVNVSVVNPVVVSLSAPSAGNGWFSFNYNASPGLAYVVEESTNLVNWVPLTTNTVSASPVLFSNSLNSAGLQFYRVGQLPNP